MERLKYFLDAIPLIFSTANREVLTRWRCPHNMTSTGGMCEFNFESTPSHLGNFYSIEDNEICYNIWDILLIYLIQIC